MKVLSIVGPTATGKSQFALEVVEFLERLSLQARPAQKMSGTFAGYEIISADSRQVYQGMEVGTGADIPAEFVQRSDRAFSYAFWQQGKVRIHGLSIILPTAEWSVGHFQELVREVLKEAAAKNHLVILVGGTGLYHAQALQLDPQLQIPPNEAVRSEASSLSLHELQAWLEKVNREKWLMMNQSDRANPRRLIRAIEIALFSPPESKKEPVVLLSQPPAIQEIQVGLTAPADFLSQQITQRVDQRLTNGMEQEVQRLIADYSDQDWQLPAFSATGYKEVRAFLAEMLSRDQLRELWSRRELQYAKRQLTWWKKHTGIEWFDVSDAKGQESALQFVAKLFIL